MKNCRNILAVSRAAMIVCLLTPLVASAQQTRARSPTEGLRETDRFIRAGEQATTAVGTAKTEVERTLTAYNTLVSQPSTDMRRDYRNLMRSVDSMNRRVTEATTRIAAMQAAADVYDKGRGLTIKDIRDKQLQTQAQQRMEQNQKDFEGVLTALREAGNALEPVRKQLTDQITFLGSDLNPSATASLKPQAEKLNVGATEVFARADAAITKASTFFNALRSQP
jgi:predicted  nucleic acid-binding Zn-ribbon protein